MLRSAPAGGTGLLALFCNLEPQWHEGFRAWLIEDMFPARRAIGFPACASYDRLGGDANADATAHRYLTLYEAPALGHLYGAPYQRLRENRDQRDKDFHTRFLDLDRATLTWVGPEHRAAADSGSPAAGFGPILVVDRLALAEKDVPRFNTWLTDVYLPACAKVPGLNRVRRYLTMERTPDDGAHHMLLHEFGAAGPRDHQTWLDLRADPAWRLATPTSTLATAWTRIVASPHTD